MSLVLWCIQKHRTIVCGDTRLWTSNGPIDGGRKVIPGGSHCVLGVTGISWINGYFGDRFIPTFVWETLRDHQELANRPREALEYIAGQLPGECFIPKPADVMAAARGLVESAPSIAIVAHGRDKIGNHESWSLQASVEALDAGIRVGAPHVKLWDRGSFLTASLAPLQPQILYQGPQMAADAIQALIHDCGAKFGAASSDAELLDAADGIFAELGLSTVGGEIDIAEVSLFGGFRWVRVKPASATIGGVV